MVSLTVILLLIVAGELILFTVYSILSILISEWIKSRHESYNSPYRP